MPVKIFQLECANLINLVKKKGQSSFQKAFTKNGKFQAISQNGFGQDVASNAIKR